MHNFITGIQQIGIGVKNLKESTQLYKKLFGLDVLIFDDTSDATLMTQYTGHQIYNRHAVLTMNLAGGGGVEVWQYKNRVPKENLTKAKFGDIGIYAAKIKCKNVQEAHRILSLNKEIVVSPIQKCKSNSYHFFITDPHGNNFHIVPGHDWFKENGYATGGIMGAVIGVSKMEKSLPFYTNFLGISEIVYDITDVLYTKDNIETECRRVLIRKKVTGSGAFNKLLGSVEIELVQRMDGKAEKIFENRYWGDCGFIHLCFDVLNMEGLKKYASSLGIQFTVDSHESFAMDNAAGRFCYAEDPDGTLIELVETHKIPVFKKLGLYINLKKRNQQKPLPDWMINLLSLSKVR